MLSLVSNVYAQETAQTLTNTSTLLNASNTTITNNQFTRDVNGDYIYSQGGGIYDFKDTVTGQTKHYWYGVHFKAAEQYASNPTDVIKTTDGRDASLSFESVDAYSSSDLVNWKKEGAVFTKDAANAFPDKLGDWQQAGWVSRLGVAHLTNKDGKDVYAMFIQHEVPTTKNPGKADWDKKVAIATSDSPAGPFAIERRVSSKNWGNPQDNTGDQTVFTDQDTGKSYLIYSNGSGRAYLYVGEIGFNNQGQVDVVTYKQIYKGAGMEGDAMFKYNGKYYYTGSALHGWNASSVQYLVADDIWGPYKNADGQENKFSYMDGSTADYSHVTQTGFYYTVKNADKKDSYVLYCGDRWSNFAGNGAGYNQWTPISFGENGRPYFNSLSRWNLDEKNATWSVADDNNFVLNGSFEADRVKVGSNVVGWTASGTDADSFSNASDNAGRVGNYFLNVYKGTDYTGSFSQNIEAGKNGSATLPDGTYALTADLRGNVEPGKADLTVVSGAAKSAVDVTKTEGYNGTTFGTLKLEGIQITGGRATVSLNANGVPGKQWLNVDDITLVRTGDVTPTDPNTPVKGGVNVKKIDGISDNFIRGADMSSALALEKAGVKFKDADGNVGDVFKIAHDAGTNWVRVRVWNKPYTESGQPYGAGNTDAATAVEIGKRATAVGMKVLVDFHYSDFWADPGKYKVPKDWARMTVDEKATALSDYTKDALTSFKNAGVNVGMVQVGNEINGGTAGEKAGSANYFTLLKAGSAAVRDVLPNALVAMHYANPEKGNFTGFADRLAKNNVDYDVFASSYYPFWHGTTDNLIEKLNYVANTYHKKVMVAETSWAYTFDDPDGANMVTSCNGVTCKYDVSVQGQADAIRDVANAVNTVDGNAGLGMFWWENSWLPVTPDGRHESGNDYVWNTTGAGWATKYAEEYDSGAANNGWGGSGVDNQALFDKDGYALASLDTYKYLKTGATAADEAVTNALADGDFEGDHTAWKVETSVTKGDDGKIAGVWVDKTNNALPADTKSINFWNKGAFAGSAKQTVTGLKANTGYTLTVDSYAQTAAGTIYQLTAKVGENTASAAIPASGWQKLARTALEFTTDDSGSAVIGFEINSTKGGDWGSLDNFTLLPSGAPSESAQYVRHSVSKTELNAAIAEGEALDYSQYTAETFANVTTALNHAKRVCKYKDATGDASQASIDVASAQLDNAISRLKERPVVPPAEDKTAPVFSGVDDMAIGQNTTFALLAGVSAIDDVDGDVTSSIKASGTVDTSTPGDYTLTYTVADKAGNIAKATRKITVTAKEKPKPTVKKNGLKQAINMAKDRLNEASKYTEESVTRLQSVLAEAQGVCNDAGVTQDQVDAAAAKLNEAVSNLEERQIEQPEQSEQAEQTHVDQNKPGSGDTAGTVLSNTGAAVLSLGTVAVALAATGIGIEVWRKRKV
jgi:arabinogalactan endo-1,4-beta-galactosidase